MKEEGRVGGEEERWSGARRTGAATRARYGIMIRLGLETLRLEPDELQSQAVGEW